MEKILNLNQSLRDPEFEIRLLNPKKETTQNNIPPKILKLSSEATVNVMFCTDFLMKK